jgi:ABC-type iron transport system FetAB ATPase subunit
MDAVKFLEEDHLATQTAMEQIALSQPTHRKELFKALRRGVEVHDTVEKNILYPWMLSNPKTAALAHWNVQSHLLVDKAMDRLEALPVEDKGWTVAFNELRVHLLKHAQNEDVSVFKKITELSTGEERNTIGHKMTTERERLLKSY